MSKTLSEKYILFYYFSSREPHKHSNYHKFHNILQRIQTN